MSQGTLVYVLNILKEGFPENLQRKEVKPRQDGEGRRLKNASTTSKIQKASKRGNSKVRKCPDLVEQQEVHLENNESCTGEEKRKSGFVASDTGVKSK